MAISPEEVISGLQRTVGAIAKAVYNKYGADGCALLSQVTDGLVSKMVEKMKTHCPGEDFETTTEFLANLAKGTGVDISREVRENEVILTHQACPMGLEGTDRDLCLAMERATRLLKGLGPDLKVEIRETVAAGDPFCQIVVK